MQQASVIASYRGRLLSAHTAQNAGKLRAGRRTVLRLLIDRSEPDILVGTFWPTDYERLMTRTGVEVGQDISTKAQQILLLAHRFDIAEQFTPVERARAGQIALTDPRIGEALEHAAAGTVPSVLACAPELIHRREQPADPDAAAWSAWSSRGDTLLLPYQVPA